jgi:DNA-binding transcriptional LysR family regulator
MDLHHLRHFIAVAEELHFGRAAARLGMTQPPLSQSVRRLESSLNLQLLERDRRHVALTPAGRVLLEEGRRVLSQVELTERLIQRAASRGVRRLRIGFTPIAMLTILPRAVQAFRKRWPGVEILLEERPTSLQIELMLNGAQDLGILYRHGAGGIDGLTMRVLGRSRYVAAFPVGHPLAQRRQVKLADLAGQAFVCHDPGTNPDAHAMFNAACRSAGFVPSVVQHANQTYTILSLVAHDVGIALVGDNARHIGLEGIALVPLTDVAEDLRQETVLAWAPWANSHALNEFVGLFEELAADRRGARRPERR